ncbi:MAG: DUF1593 domain-containing protein [Bacteroidales bacterium]|nr:DUF1593 domain-containing protein [Bacteroidales bacterium]
MKLKYVTLVSLLFVMVQVSGIRWYDGKPLKPRIVVLTDVSTWETDDSESLVRLFAHADMFEIEGLIYTTGWSLEETRDDFFQLIHDAIDAYEKDLPNLMKRSGQTGFEENESRQVIGYWPDAEYLRKCTMNGSKKRGIGQIGKENVSDGSNHIIKMADEDDERPLWILIWGGGNTLAQAIWQVQQERDENDLKAFLHKIPTYAITDQDRSYKEGTPFEISSHQWMRREFAEDLMFIWDECAWKFQNGTGRKNWDEYALHIQSHGNLGKVYPKFKYGVEGDTPSFLHVMPNGLNNPLIPGQVGWGGYFEWAKGADDSTFAYTNHKGKAGEICAKYEGYFYPATFNNFAARMDWAAYGKGNRNPVVIVNGDRDITPVHIHKKQGKSIVLDASESFDPDGNRLSYKWWVLPEAGTYQQEISLSGENSNRISVNVPSGSAGKCCHVICEVTDNGEPNLTSYRRVIIHSEK